MANMRLASLALLLTIAAGTGATQQPSGDTPFSFPPAEWPGGASALHIHRTVTIGHVAADRLRRFPDSPNTVGWLWQAKRFDAAFDVLTRIAERAPARLAEALPGVDPHPLQMDEARAQMPRARSLVAAAQLAIPALNREQAAAVAAALMPLRRATEPERANYDALLDAFLTEYAGTETARLLEVDRVIRGRPSLARLTSLDAIAASAPGTVVAAKARYQKGFQLARNWSNFVLLDRADPDPTNAFLEVLDIVADLESGRYPPCRWVDEAASLVTGYSMFQPKIAPDNARRMIEGIVGFVRRHPALITRSANESGTYLVANFMARVAAVLPDGPAVMDLSLTELEKGWADPAAAKLLRAAWWSAEPQNFLGPAALRPAWPTREADIRALMAEAATSAAPAIATMALAQLAEREFADPSSLPSALAHYREFERRFPSDNGVWVASLRAAQVEQAMGRLQDAAASFRRAADAHPDDQVVRVLAFGYAAKVDEARSDFAAARRGYDAAIEAWSADVNGWLALDPPLNREAAQRLLGNALPRNPALLERDAIERRAAQLARVAGLAGGDELERGRWLLNERRPQEATQVLSDVSRRYSGEPTGRAAAVILKHARLDAAIDAATDSKQRSDTRRELDALITEPFDGVGGMAAVIRATLLMRGGDQSDADTAMRAALGRWAASSVSRAAPPSPGSLEADVLAIRDAVFTPLGHRVFGSNWNAAEWPQVLPVALMARASLDVTTADGSRRIVDVARQPPGLTNVVFVGRDEIDFLTRAVSRLGGTARREPTAVMQVPNQPIGGAREIIQWWNQYFPARPGHWSGFEILSYPAFSRIEFTNAERTQAQVPFAIGFSGSTVALGKVNGAWVMKELTGNFWIQ